MNCFILSTNLCKLLHSNCEMCKLFFVLVLLLFFCFFFHKGHQNWWSGRTIYTVEPEQTWAAGPVAPLAWASQVSDWWDWRRKTNSSLPNLFVSCISARPLTQATIADSLQWGYSVVISAIHPFLLFLLKKWERRRNQLNNCFCHLCVMFLACASSVATITAASLHRAILAIHFCPEFFFHSPRIFFFLSIGLFPSVFHPNFFSFTRTIFLSLHWAISIRFHPEFFFHSHGQFFFLSIGLF